MKSKMMYTFTVGLLVMFATTVGAMASGPVKIGSATKISTMVLTGPHAFAQESAPEVKATGTEEVSPPPAVDPAPEVSDGAWYKSAIEAVIRIAEVVRQEGLGTLAIALTALLAFAQLIIQLTKTALFGRVFPKVGHLGKLAIVSVCTVVTTLVPMLLSGVPFLTALTSGAVFTALMVAGNQVWQGIQGQKKA